MKNLAVLSVIAICYLTTVDAIFGMGATRGHEDSGEINPWWPKSTTSTTTPRTTSTTTKKPYTKTELIQKCINSCPVKTDYNPVCGSNGITYDNPGKLECARHCGVDVKLQRKSKCTDVDRGRNLTRISIDFCVAACPVDNFFHPVCGSNGVTYVNPARLKCVQTCGVNVHIAKFQPCFTFPDPNEKLTNIEVLACRNTCPATTENKTVCGTDGNNYKNEEVLQCARKCGINVSIQSWNKCLTTTIPPVTPEITTPNPKIQDKDKIRKIVECMQHCPLTSECKPVCGTDGVTYRNPGRLICSQMCGVDVQMSKYGQCSSFSVINFANCQPSGHIVDPPPPPPPTPLEKCLKLCWVPNDWSPVCGTNDITYKNIEDLQCAQSCGINVWLKTQTACNYPVGNYGDSDLEIPPEVLDKILSANVEADDVTNLKQRYNINPSESINKISSISSAENKIMVF